MMRRHVLVAVMLVGGLAAATGGVRAQQTGFKRTVLQQVDLSAPGREAVQARAEISPGGQAGRHTHPGEEIGFVELGPIVLEVEGKPARTLQTGEVFLIPPATVHNARNTGTGAAKIVSTYVVEKGKPLASPAP